MNHYLYKTTCLHPDAYGMEYVGIRSCSCPIADDVYIGSGNKLKEYVRGYGAENFMKEVLIVADSREYIAAMEAGYVDWEYINRTDTLNLVTGGEEAGRLNKRMSADSVAKHRAGVISAVTTPEHREKQRLGTLKRYSDPKEKEKARELGFELWERPEYRDKLMKSRQSEEYKTKQRKISKQKWDDPVFKKEQLRLRKDKEYLKNKSDRAKITWSDKTTKSRLVASIIKANKGMTQAYIVSKGEVQQLPIVEYRELKSKGMAIHTSSKEYQQLIKT